MNSEKNKRNKALKMMLWFGMASLFMTFAGLTSAFIVSKNRVDWIENFNLPEAFNFSLIIIILSSILLFFSQKFLQRNENKKSSVLLFLVIILGILFVIFQIVGFDQFIKNNIHFTGPTSIINASFVYLIAAVHILHVIAGILSLSFVFFKNLKGAYNNSNSTGFDIAATFWHFIDILWIYLFIFLVFFG